MSSKKTCIHIIWCLVNIFGLNKTDPLLAQIEFDYVILRELFEKRPPEIPEHLKNYKSTARTFHPKLLEHPKFSIVQHWFISRKTSGAPHRCSGCMKRKKKNVGDLHLCVNGLLYLERYDRFVETKLRLCLQSSCVRNIRTLYNNIRPLLMLNVKKNTLSGELSKEEMANIELEGFTVEGVTSVLPGL